MKSNPVGWFEIYVQDMPRAKAFYEAVFQGTLESLISRQYQLSKLIIETNDLNRSAEILQRLQLNGTTEQGKIVLPIPSKQTIALLNTALVNAGIEVYEMSAVKKDLETIFMELINV